MAKKSKVRKIFDTATTMLCLWCSYSLKTLLMTLIVHRVLLWTPRKLSLSHSHVRRPETSTLVPAILGVLPKTPSRCA
ncbi:hypothetical protein F5141DRAFT_1137689 [Pisolithus sp. B1]|nr:hypothetical protein F5141DRAFT_1137689 [Pisolithus sp. B1]